MEHILVELIVALFVAAAGYVTGSFREKQKHNLEIQTIGLKLSIEAYQELLDNYFDLTVMSGKLCSGRKNYDERDRLSNEMMSALKAFTKSSYNPLISSDPSVEESRKITNDYIATIDTYSRELSNNNHAVYGMLSESQQKLVDDNRKLCEKVSSKYYSITIDFDRRQR